MYIEKSWDMGDVVEIHKFYPGNYGAPGEKRKAKSKISPEALAKQNERIRKEKLQRLILANFHEGDWHLVLKYKKDKYPETYEEGREQLKRFLRRMREQYQEYGYEFKWIAVTERGKKKAILHHHLVIEDIPEIKTTKLVKKLWDGITNFTDLYSDGEYEQLADYLCKKETKEENKGCTYSHSRNLKVPEPVIEKKYKRRWPEEPEVPKGWYLVKDSLWNGTNKLTGMPSQRYKIKRLPNDIESEFIPRDVTKDSGDQKDRSVHVAVRVQSRRPESTNYISRAWNFIQDKWAKSRFNRTRGSSRKNDKRKRH